MAVGTPVQQDSAAFRYCFFQDGADLPRFPSEIAKFPGRRGGGPAGRPLHRSQPAAGGLVGQPAERAKARGLPRRGAAPKGDSAGRAPAAALAEPEHRGRPIRASAAAHRAMLAGMSAAAKRLRDGGFDEDQAEAAVSMVRDAAADRDQPVTKADLATLRADIRTDIAAEIASLERRLLGYGIALAGLLFAALELF